MPAPLSCVAFCQHEGTHRGSVKDRGAACFILVRWVCPGRGMLQMKATQNTQKALPCRVIISVQGLGGSGRHEKASGRICQEEPWAGLPARSAEKKQSGERLPSALLRGERWLPSPITLLGGCRCGCSERLRPTECRAVRRLSGSPALPYRQVRLLRSFRRRVRVSARAVNLEE